MKKTIKTMAVAMLLVFTMIMGACGQVKIDANAKLVDIDDGAATIELGYGNFVARYNQAAYDMYYGMYFGDDVWSQEMTSSGTTFQDQTKDSIMEELKRIYVLNSKAEEYKVSISDEDNKKIADAAAKFMSNNSDEAIEQMGATEEYVIRMLTENTIAIRVEKAIKAEAKVSVDDDEAAQSTFSYAFFSTEATIDEEGNSIELTDDEKTAKKDAADAVAEAEDFDAAVTDQGEEVKTYSFSTNGNSDDETLDATIIDAAKKLEDGEMSEVITVDEKGYYVVRMDKVSDSDATQSKKEALEEAQRNEYATTVIDKLTEAVKWTVDENNWSKVQFDKLFDTKVETDSEE